MGTYGQDWSSYQSAQPSTQGLGFAYVKATEGLGYTNPLHAAQVAHARADGLVVGHYHYPHMANSPATEADFFLKTAQPQTGDLLCLDWEGYDAANKGVSFSRQIAYKEAFLAHLRTVASTHQHITYCNIDYLNRDPKGQYGDALWIATAGRPAGQPGISHAWKFHQYGASGVDRDYCSLSVADLKAWAHAKAAPPAPKPPAKPSVSLKHIVYAARHDPAATQGHASYRAEVLLVERALQAEGLLDKQWADGSFGSKTIDAYARWQRHLGYAGTAADGIPGRTSLSKLAARHGFTVTD